MQTLQTPATAYLPILLLLTSQLILLPWSSERKLQQSVASSLRSPQVHCAALLLHAFSLPPLGPCPCWPLTVSKVFKFLTCSRPTTCPLEPIQTIRRTITSAFTHLIDSSLSTRHLSIYIQSVLRWHHHSRNPNLGQMGNFHPVSFLLLLFETVEGAVLKQIIEIPSRKFLLDLNHSWKSGHSTEIAPWLLWWRHPKQLEAAA